MLQTVGSAIAVAFVSAPEGVRTDRVMVCKFCENTFGEAFWFSHARQHVTSFLLHKIVVVICKFCPIRPKWAFIIDLDGKNKIKYANFGYYVLVMVVSMAFTFLGTLSPTNRIGTYNGRKGVSW